MELLLPLIVQWLFGECLLYCFCMIKGDIIRTWETRTPVKFSTIFCVIGLVVCAQGLPCWFCGKECTCSAGDTGGNPGSERSAGAQRCHLLQYSCLKNPMHRRVWWATVHRLQRVGRNLVMPCVKDRKRKARKRKASQGWLRTRRRKKTKT